MCSLNNYFKFQNLNIRNASDADVVQMVPLINEAYSYIEEIRKKPRTNNENLLEKFKENDYYVLTSGKKIVGCFYIDIDDDYLHFGMFALLPEYRGVGLGKEILKAIERFAKSKNLKRLVIDRMSTSPWLKKYYEDQGFVETGKNEMWGEIELIGMQKDIF